MGLFGKLKLAWYVRKALKRAEEVKKMAERSFWKSKQFRLGLVTVIGGALALLAGETTFGDFVKQNWEAIGGVIGGLALAFNAHGRVRQEKAVAAAVEEMKNGGVLRLGPGSYRVETRGGAKPIVRSDGP